MSSARSMGSSARTFPLTLTATVPGSTIRYTLDGSTPTATLGTVYTGPITITPDTAAAKKGTRLVRAIAISPKAAYSPVATNTYLFINGVTNPATEGVVAQSTLVAFDPQPRHLWSAHRRRSARAAHGLGDPAIGPLGFGKPGFHRVVRSATPRGRVPDRLWHQLDRHHEPALAQAQHGREIPE